MDPAAVGGGGALSISRTANPAASEPNFGTSSPLTFAAQACGSANASRLVIVTFACYYTGGTLTWTIGGVAATAFQPTLTGNRAAGVAYAVVPTGTTADVVCTHTNFSIATMVIQVFVCPTSANPVATASAQAADTYINPTLSYSGATINTNGFGLTAICGADSTKTSETLAGYTTDTHTAGVNVILYNGHSTSAGTPSASLSGAADQNMSYVTISWGP